MKNHSEGCSIVAGSKSWNKKVFEEVISRYRGRWVYLGEKEQLTLAAVEKIKPRYIFFLHWSWKVPDELIGKYECVCFHMTDVPYGRGGSPLQNLIVRGHRDTMVTALRMSAAMDAGPVYLKRSLSLEGNAEEIYRRATGLSAEMIGHMIETEPEPIPQRGQAVVFSRRKPEQSAIPVFSSSGELYDHIRMLDAEGYPRAYLIYNGFRYEFSHAVLQEGRLVADVKISPVKEGDS